jgi:NitT/TauT family transport system substrate-binding protein
MLKPAIVPILLVALAGCGATSGTPSGGSGAQKLAATSDTPVRLAASQNVTGNSFVWITHDAGLFAKSVDLQSINATIAVKSLVAGQLDAVVLGSPEQIAARAAGSPIKVVGAFLKVFDLVFVVPSDVSDLKELRGKTVGVITKNSINGIGGVRAMRSAGLEPGRDYKLVETGSAGTYQAMIAQLGAHQIDAAPMQLDFARKAVAQGGVKVLFDLAKSDLRVASASLGFQDAFISQHPADVQATVDALIKGVRYAHEHPADAKATLARYYKFEGEALDQAYERQTLIQAKDPTPAPEQFQDTMEAQVAENPAVKNLDVNSLFDARFAQDAVKRGLTSY